MKPIILVTGATGAQGGSVARALLAAGDFTVRILTRNANTENAIALQLAGAEIAEGDMDNPRSLKAAMKDCYGVFGVTSYWEHFDNEFQQGKNLIDAVKQAGIQHFIYSSLPDYNRISKGMYTVPHCDIKASLQRYAESLSIPASFVQVSFYYENFLSFFPLQPDERDDLYIGFPQGATRLAAVSVDDLGPVVGTMFNKPRKYIGKTIPVIGADMTGAEYARMLSKALKRKVYYRHIPRQHFASMHFTGAEELANMFHIQRLYMTGSKQNLLQQMQDIHPGTKSFEIWATKNAKRIDKTLHDWFIGMVG